MKLTIKFKSRRLLNYIILRIKSFDLMFLQKYKSENK